MLPGMSSSPPSPPRVLGTLPRDEDDKYQLVETLGVEAGLQLLDAPAGGELEENLRDTLAFGLSWFSPAHWHRSLGYLFATFLLSKRRLLQESLAEFIPSSAIDEQLEASALGISTDAAYEYIAAMITTNNKVLAVVAKDMILYIRENPCQLLPLWEASPARFVIEYIRLKAPMPPNGAAGKGTEV